MNSSESVARFIATCKRCGLTVRIERKTRVDYYTERHPTFGARTRSDVVDIDSRPIPAHCTCGKSLSWREMRGVKRDDVKCDARCTGAKGHNCECQCGGKNHGSAHDSAA